MQCLEVAIQKCFIKNQLQRMLFLVHLLAATLYKKKLCDSCFPVNLKSSHQRCSMKKDVLRNFTKFTEKHRCQACKLIKKKDCSTGVFLWIL